MGISAQELRIGNWVYYQDNCPLKAITLKFDDMKSVFFDEKWVSHFLKPIPLTEEWLFKLGFTKEYGSICLKLLQSDNEIRLIDCNPFEPNKEWSISAMPHLIIKLKYVHQLQNLFYSLCGDELTVKQLA